MTCFLQCGSGLPALSIIVTYDIDSNELRIATNIPFALPMEFMNITYDPGNFIVFNPPDFYQVDPTHWVLPNAAGRASGGFITNIDFYDNPVTTLLGNWSGMVPIPDIFGTFPTLTGIYSPAPDTVAFTGTQFLTGAAGAITNACVRMASYSNACFDGGAVCVNLPGGSGDWTVVTFTDTLLELSNPRFSSCTPDDLAPNFTVTGLVVNAPNFGSPPGDGYSFYEPWGDPSPYSAVIDGSTPVPP